MTDPLNPAHLPAPEVLLAEPDPILDALRLHLRARVGAGEVLLVSDGDRSRVEAALRELAVAGRELAIPAGVMESFYIPPAMLDEYRERPTNRAMRRARKQR